MLPVVKTDEVVDLVFSFDDAVRVEVDPPRALPKDGTEIDGTATVVSVRALSGTDTLRVLGDGTSPQHEVVIDAALRAVSQVATGEETATGEGARALLDRLPPVAVSAVGAWVLEQSLDTADPLGASESAESSGQTSSAAPTDSTVAPATGNGASRAAALISASSGAAAR